jgi:hypothetical protein
MVFNPKCLSTGIGSFPHKDPSAACDIILKAVPDIPLWPQLSTVDFREQMEIQYSEGLPCVVLDEAKQRMYFDTGGDPTSALEQFYENYMSENLEHFKISSDFSRGLYEMEKRLLKVKSPDIRFLKNQVTGPITFGLSIVDENKRAVYYNDIFRDVIVKGLVMKARWLLNRFKPMGYDQICFIDEPILSAFGSSTYIGLQRQDIIGHLKEMIEAIHAESALVGIHCCGNTEWTILIEAGVDIISFDAYEYGETIGYYPEQIRQFLEGGGSLAWGIVPTSDKILQETTDSLSSKLEDLMDKLANKGVDRDLLWEKCLLTPSCGTGTLSVELCERAFVGLQELKNRLCE